MRRSFEAATQIAKVATSMHPNSATGLARASLPPADHEAEAARRLRLAVPDDARADDARARALLSFATLLLWLKPLHVLRLSPTAGPLVLTVERMLVRDVRNWLMLFSIILVSFTAAIYVIYASPPLSDAGDRPDYIFCVEPDAWDVGGWNAHALWYLRHFWENALLNDADFGCAAESSRPVSTVKAFCSRNASATRAGSKLFCAK